MSQSRITLDLRGTSAARSHYGQGTTTTGIRLGRAGTAAQQRSHKACRLAEALLLVYFSPDELATLTVKDLRLMACMAGD